MHYQDIFINFLTSSFVIGIATYFIQKRIDSRLKKIEEFQKTLLSIRKERYDTLLKTLQEIWEKLVETEYYIRWDLAEQLNKTEQTNQKHLELDPSPLKNAYIFIEKRSILLNDALSTKTRELFIQHLQKTYNGYIKILNDAIEKKKTLSDVNEFIPSSLGQQYKNDIDTLRKEFEKQAREILYDEK